jgi:hypothetical protein
MEVLQLQHTSGQWMPSIDSSKVSLEAVLFHNGNKFPSVPLAHTLRMKETYENFRVLLQKIRYEEHRWNVFADMKVITMLMVKQGGYSKFCSF